MAVVEWVVSLSTNRTLYPVVTANTGGFFGVKIFYEGPAPDKVYQVTSSGYLPASDALTMLNTLNYMAGTSGAVFSFVDSRGNSFSGPIWGVIKFSRPVLGSVSYGLQFHMTNPTGSLNN